MTAAERIGVLGGTFDPIHLGHLETAVVAADAIALTTVLVMPSRVPPHRHVQPRASSHHRFAMVSLAVADRPRLIASDLELESPGPSYTSHTLDLLEERGIDLSQLFFITGADAFAEIATWRHYPAILDRCHFVVVARPGFTLARSREAVPELTDRMIDTKDAGVSGREHQRGHARSIYLVDERTADVSATEVRRRAASGESLAGLVAPAVETHIRRHGLYASSQTLHPSGRALA